MQDRYAGDVGDFGKLGLLRHLTAAAPALRLGVLWYRALDEGHNNDGRHTGYLTADTPKDATLRACDPQLAQNLAQLVQSGERSIAGLQRASSLPPQTRFHDTPLDLTETLVAGRPAARARWFEEACATVRETDLVFLDPDNGLQTKGMTDGQAKVVKYVLDDDLVTLRRRGHSLVLYHHLARTDTHPRQIAELRQRLTTLLELPTLPDAAVFRRGSARVFFIVPARNHAVALAERLDSFARSAWGDIFEVLRGDTPSTAPTRSPDHQLAFGQGQHHATQRILRRALTHRYGPLSSEHERQLLVASLEDLESWLTRLLRPRSLEEILAAP